MSDRTETSWGWLVWGCLAALILGGVGFVAGFYGPIHLTPGANQGPLLGIFITGPAGAVAGLLLGLLLCGLRNRLSRGASVTILGVCALAYGSWIIVGLAIEGRSEVEDTTGICMPLEGTIEQGYRVSSDRTPRCLEHRIRLWLVEKEGSCGHRKEMGSVSGNSGKPDWTLHLGDGAGESSYTWHVRFDTAFETVPHILVRPTHLRLDRDDPETYVNLRYENFSREGFDISLYARADSHLDDVTVEWTAVEVLQGSCVVGSHESRDP